MLGYKEGRRRRNTKASTKLVPSEAGIRSRAWQMSKAHSSCTACISGFLGDSHCWKPLSLDLRKLVSVPSTTETPQDLACFQPLAPRALCMAQCIRQNPRRRAVLLCVAFLWCANNNHFTCLSSANEGRAHSKAQSCQPALLRPPEAQGPHRGALQLPSQGPGKTAGCVQNPLSSP